MHRFGGNLSRALIVEHERMPRTIGVRRPNPAGVNQSQIN